MCTELKIPLFIIGKPGSSKSLAKSLIAQKMQGPERLDSPILRNFKEAQLITFQCSPLSSSEMILKTFRQCANYQYNYQLEPNNKPNQYLSVVVLDEIGLAEASKSMPLKVLHPLLEEGVYFDVPSSEELEKTINDICGRKSFEYEFLRHHKLIQPLSNGFLKLWKLAKEMKNELCGLRDFYFLIKNIYAHIKENKQLYSEYRSENDIVSRKADQIDWSFLTRVINSNFSHLKEFNALDLFINEMKEVNIELELLNEENERAMNFDQEWKRLAFVGISNWVNTILILVLFPFFYYQ